MLQTSSLSKDFKDLDVEPLLMDYNHKQTGPIAVKLSNITTRTISIPPRAIVCELQPVTFHPDTHQPSEEKAADIISQMEFTKSDRQPVRQWNGPYQVVLGHIFNSR